MVTLKEIARRCNVSITSVSNVLNGKPKVSEETRRLVLRVVEETGYQPNYIAQGLRKQTTSTIGIIADDISEFSTPKMIESVMAYCESKGYRTVVQNLRLFSRWGDNWYDKEKELQEALEIALNEFQSNKVDGIVYVASYGRDIRNFPTKIHTPVVMAYAYMDADNVDYYLVDDEKGGYEITKYLIEMGHKNIGVIGGREDNMHTQKRLEGYKRALNESGIAFKADNVRFGAWERATGKKGMEHLLKKKVTAVFCMADQIAGGVYDCLYEKGLEVGKDVSVVGYDNQQISEYMRPALTTMMLPLKEVGDMAIKELISIIQGEKIASGDQLYVPCKLIVRDSVCKLEK